MKRAWARSLYKSRDSYFFQKIKLPKILLSEKKYVKKFIKIDFKSLKYLVDQLRAKLERKHHIRKPISVTERILITLR